MKNKKYADAQIENGVKLKRNRFSISSERASSISAKPKINKLVMKSHAKINTKCKENQVLEKCLKQNIANISEFTIITPQVSLISPIADDEPSTSKSLDIELEFPVTPLEHAINEDLDTKSLPIIVKANLKKSSSYYIPKVLKCEKEIKKESEKSEKTVKETSESVKTIDIADFNSNNSMVFTQNLHCNIPKALQDFYNEITEEIEPKTEESSQVNKNLEKTSESIVNTSDRYSNHLMDIASTNTASLENLSLINQKHIIQFFSLENKVIVILSPSAKFSFLGKLKLQVLYGAVQLYGAIFSSQNTMKPVEIYSPRGYSSIDISIFDLDKTYDKEALWDALTIEGVDRSLFTTLHSAINACKRGWSVILLQNLTNTLTNFLNKFYKFKLFPKVENMWYSWNDPRRAEYVLQANFQCDNSQKEISICPQWNTTITEQLVNQWNSTKAFCTIIVGGKSVGKSTTVRYLINNLLRHSKKVILLDLDPGQTEMTPAASVSLNVLDEPLLGPNFTHVKKPFYQLYIEDISVENSISRYIICIKKMLRHLKNNKDLSQYPVVVNTMGFCKGIGLDICIILIKLIEPTNVIQIQSSRTINNFKFSLTKQIINKYKTANRLWINDDEVMNKVCNYKWHCTFSKAEGKRQFNNWNIEPRQQRELMLLAYLSQIMENADKQFLNYTWTKITDIIPYKLPFSAFCISLQKSSVASTHILAAMNGNIIALCGVDLDNYTSTNYKNSSIYPKVLMEPPPYTCYGYGIVRGVNLKQRCIESELQQVNLLAGCMTMPFALQCSDKPTGIPYAGNQGGLPTSREARRGYYRSNQTKFVNH
ncbi:PREDICTED: polynucleotide 5'-hydroxyl-kinase NOL9 [Ceratosolen solmsi marchali]|uniref:Polynucleotide 5'-hydroxyl-kinase NOL9 n=1 Tax=Ceratosolen solmsi marchali TaxID=326594 RepID=A0AAJ6YQ63_9HYME|nr:PREDICTED: polynucleotide 5'-hydroxyl-kinase NOL9 [Ceratosolen solmsi marchali]